MPTVSAPTSREMRATTGAAPVPVPPPAPAVMNTMSAPLSRALIWSYSSIGGLAAELGVGARAEAAGGRAADVHLGPGAGVLERLEVGVDGDELDALDAGLDHAVDGVDAGAADAHHAQHRLVHVRLAGHGPELRLRHGLLVAGCRGGALHDVLRDVGGEDVAQPLLGLRNALERGRSGSRRGSSPVLSSSVLRKSWASGPSRMLARLPLAIRENLLR